jgi:hypothetical protein
MNPTASSSIDPSRLRSSSGVSIAASPAPLAALAAPAPYPLDCRDMLPMTMAATSGSICFSTPVSRPVCWAPRRHLTAHVFAAEHVTEYGVAVGGGRRIGQRAGIVEIPLVLTAGQGGQEFGQPVVGGHVALQAGRQRGNERGDRR